jgi:F-type H+-transporting ATPase subunit a
MNFLQIIQPNPHLEPAVLFKIAGFSVTNSMLLTWLVVLIILGFSFYLKRKAEVRAVKKIQLAFEIVVEQIIGLLNQITQSEERSKKLFPIVGSIFLFFVLTNTIALIPGIGAIEYGEYSLFRVPTTDFNTTLALAVLVVLLAQFVSLKNRGFLGHLGEYFKFKDVFLGFKQGISQGFLSLINFAMGLLDIMGELAKVISLSLRLFGNMFAGEVLMVVTMSFLAFVAPSFLVAQTLLIGVLQAMVFSVLSAVYLNLSFNNN